MGSVRCSDEYADPVVGVKPIAGHTCERVVGSWACPASACRTAPPVRHIVTFRRSSGVDLSSLSYEQANSLISGTGSVVERLDPAVMALIAIDTPVTAYLRSVIADDYPQHIVLSGNAGDGKTFLAVTLHGMLPPDAWEVVTDASEEDVELLGPRLTRALEHGKRIFMAINRGKLERLHDWVRASPDDAGPLARLVDAVEHGLRLRVAWDGELDLLGEVATVDLGVFDSLADEVIDGVLDRLVEVQPPPGQGARAAFDRAQATLRDSAVRNRIKEVLRAVQASGRHVTMRQLWQGLTTLLTGSRRAGDADDVRIEDSVGARLFPDGDSAPLLALAREAMDPSVVPQPGLTRIALRETMGSHLDPLPGLRGLGFGEACSPTVVRAAWLHGSGEAAPPEPVRSRFGVIAGRLAAPAPEGWQEDADLVEDVLNGVYDALGLWRGSDGYYAWERLCYDSRLMDRAGALASGLIDVDRLRVALPRPNPRAQQALKGAYRPPYLLLGDPDAAPGDALHIGSAMLERLLAPAAGRGEPLIPADEEILRRWLARLPRRGEKRFAVRRPGEPPAFLNRTATGLKISGVAR